MPVVLPTHAETLRMRPHLVEQSKRRAIAAVRDLFEIPNPESDLAPRFPPDELYPSFDTVLEEARWIEFHTPADPHASAHRRELIESLGPDLRGRPRRAA